MGLDSYMSEHYSEYKIELAEGNYDQDEVTLYFERDAGDSLVRYKLFLTLKEWNKLANLKGDPSFKDKLAGLSYDTVEVVYDAYGVDCASLSNQLSQSFKDAEIKFSKHVEEYLSEGAILTFNQLEKQFSGVGQILLISERGGKKEVKGKFFFAINDINRIKVDYVIKNTSNGVDITLRCKNRGAAFDVMLLKNDSRLPCLLGDKSSSVGGVKLVDFNGNNEINISFDLPPHQQNKFYSLAFSDDENEKYYILNLLYEDSFDVLVTGHNEPLVGKFYCPYCGSQIKDRNLIGAYESNPVICSNIGFGQSVVRPQIKDKNGDTIIQSIFCKADLEVQQSKAYFKPNRMRLLPKQFYDHKQYKIMLLGSTRAGKTTFLSRFFGLTHIGNEVNMSLKYLASAMAKFGVSVNAASAPALNVIGDATYQVSDKNYYINEPFYKERAIDLDSGSFPGATTTNTDCTSYPFILETNTKNATVSSYISFYDIPGEDARTRELSKFQDKEIGGIFLFINAVNDRQGNEAIINHLKSAKLPQDTPIAIILAKADLRESQFLPSSHILRTDYYDIPASIPYEQGIGREILCSSMEVRSFLQNESLITDLETQYDNISYFALSNFSFKNSIHHDSSDYNRPGQLTFENTTKRLELPFLWMLKQFGLL